MLESFNIKTLPSYAYTFLEFQYYIVANVILNTRPATVLYIVDMLVLCSRNNIIRNNGHKSVKMFM